MSPTYASTTDVSADRSIGEIKKVLMRYGADQFAYMENVSGAIVAFTAHGYQVRFALPLPGPSEFRLTPSGRTRTSSAARDAHQQALRQRWRALVLVVKAKLEAVESGIVTFEQEFGMHMVMGNGASLGEAVMPLIAQSQDQSALLQIGTGDD